MTIRLLLVVALLFFVSQAQAQENGHTDNNKTTGSGSKTKTSVGKSSANKTAKPVVKFKKSNPAVSVTPITGGGAESASPGRIKQEPALPTAITTTPMPPLIRKVTTLIESSPTSCDIEVDGVYVGTTPVQLSLQEGVHFVRLHKEGFIDWERTVKAYNGLVISPTLVSESTYKEDRTRAVTIK